MKKLEKLPEIALRQLGGLEASPELYERIRAKSTQARVASRAAVRWRPVVAIAMALIVLAGGAVLWQSAPEGVRPGGSVIDSHSAGDEAKVTQPPLSADLPHGSIAMSGGAGSGGGSLFADAQGSSFPLITIGGATYRMLSTPNGISSGLLGTNLGTVNEYNIEPALGSGTIVSNVVSQGEAVCAISGMDGAMVAANVNGVLRVFQRVSYAGTATIGGESLADTLCSSGSVDWMELDGVGVLQGDDARAVMDILLQNADYTSTGMSGRGSLRIGLTNGLTMQLLVGDDAVSACGTWICPDFFEAFHEAIGK